MFLITINEQIFQTISINFVKCFNFNFYNAYVTLIIKLVLEKRMKNLVINFELF